MNITFFTDLSDRVEMLPHMNLHSAGGEVRQQALDLEDRALKLKIEYEALLGERDRFINKIHRLWTREERKESGL